MFLDLHEEVAGMFESYCGAYDRTDFYSDAASALRIDTWTGLFATKSVRTLEYIYATRPRRGSAEDRAKRSKSNGLAMIKRWSDYRKRQEKTVEDMLLRGCKGLEIKQKCGCSTTMIKRVKERLGIVIPRGGSKWKFNPETRKFEK